MRVANVERTVVDVLDRLEISGGWEEVVRSLEHVRVLDAPAACDYALRPGRASAAAKLGLDLHSHREELSVDSSVLRELTAALPRRTHRVDRRHTGPFRVIFRWRLSVPEALFDPAWDQLLEDIRRADRGPGGGARLRAARHGEGRTHAGAGDTLATSPLLRQHLVLEGGTALNLFLLDLPASRWTST